MVNLRPKSAILLSQYKEKTHDVNNENVAFAREHCINYLLLTVNPPSIAPHSQHLKIPYIFVWYFLPLL